MTRKAKTILTIIMLLIGLAGISGGIYMNYDEWFAPKDPGTLDYDPNAEEYTPPNTNNLETVGIAIPGWESITIPANTKNVRVDFPNPISNKDKYNLTFQLKIDDVVYYESGLVKPGHHITYITLTEVLSAGTYEAIIHVQPYKIEEKTPTNNSDVKITLNVVEE